jgi:hypothetical protein
MKRITGWEWLVVAGIALVMGGPTVAAMILPHDSPIVRILLGGQVVVMAAGMGVAFIFVLRVSRQARVAREKREPDA